MTIVDMNLIHVDRFSIKMVCFATGNAEHRRRCARLEGVHAWKAFAQQFLAEDKFS